MADVHHPQNETAASDSPRWYVIHTYSGYENKVEQNIKKVVENRGLQDLVQQVLIPVEKVKEINGNKEKVIDRKIYPGYVLVKMIYTEETWAVIRSTRGVTGFVGPDSKPTPLSDREVAAMGVDAPSAGVIEVGYKEGDDVRIIATNLSGMSGKVSRIDEANGTVGVLVDFFGRPTPTTLALGQVVKLDD